MESKASKEGASEVGESSTNKEPETTLPPNSEDAISQQTTETDEVDQYEKYEKDLARYQPLRRAIYTKDWKAVESFVSKNPQALTDDVTEFHDSIFNIIVDKSPPKWLLKKLASMVQKESLVTWNDYRLSSAIFDAARSGNRKAAEIFVHWDKDLPNNWTWFYGLLPVHVAAKNGHKETVEYLLTVTTASFDGYMVVLMLEYLINSSLYGTAFDLLKRNPKLAREQVEDRRTILQVLAKRPKAFESGSQLGRCQHFFYHYVPVQEEYIPWFGSMNGDAENPIEKSTNFAILGVIYRNLNIMFWKALMLLAPSIKSIRDMKSTHTQTLEIVSMMCNGVTWDYDKAYEAFRDAILTAAKFGIYELVNEIVLSYHRSFQFRDDDDRDIFELAVLYRHKEVFDLIHKVGKVNLHRSLEDRFDNILHLAGKLLPSSRIAGAALQMQRELQWFKAVEDVCHQSFQEHLNSSNKTPREVFTEEHELLVKEGEKWMKDTATSCTVVATLIITIVFAAAFTVPGGNNNGGTPNFLQEKSFIVFAIADALALFSSTTSLLMFLAILTSRYTEEDFLKSLPRKLIIGLVTLFIAIVSMMVTFGATICIVLSNPWKWVIGPIVLLGSVPVTSFVLLQSPLLVEMISSTFVPTMFGPMKNL